METKIIKICKKWKCAVEVLSNMDRVCNSWGQINRLHSDWLAQYCVQQSYIFAIYLFAIYKLSLKLFYISYFIRRDSLEYPAQYWHQLISYFSNIYEIVKLFCNIFAIFRSFLKYERYDQDLSDFDHHHSWWLVICACHTSRGLQLDVVA